MIININYFIRFGVHNIEFMDKLMEEYYVFEDSCILSTFCTDGEIEWNGTVKIKEVSTDIFKIANANYILSYAKNKSDEEMVGINLCVSDLLFNKALPSYDIINKSPYSLISKEKLEKEQSSINEIETLLDYKKDISALENKVFMSLNDKFSQEEKITNNVSDILSKINELQISLDELIGILMDYYNDNDIISKEKVKKIISYNQKTSI